jgi:DNA-binding CsgD family transcriptional regulator
MQKSNERYIRERIYRFYSWKTFAVIFAMLAGMGIMEYGIPWVDCGEDYWGWYPVFMLVWILAGFLAAKIVVHRLKTGGASLDKLMLADKIHIIGVYLVIGILNPVFAVEYYRGSWWGVIPALTVAASCPWLGQRTRWVILSAPAVSLGLHYLFWSNVNGKVLAPIDPIFTLIYTAILMVLVVMITNRQFNYKLFSTDEPVEVFLARYDLSSREMEIAQLVYQGLGTKEIADRLFISIETVRKHFKSIYQKTGVHSRSDLVHLYYRG